MKRRLFKLGALALSLFAGGAIINFALAVALQFHTPHRDGTMKDALSKAQLDSIWKTHGIGEEYRRTLAGWRVVHLGATITRAGNEMIAVNGNEGGFNAGGAATFILILETGFPIRFLTHAHTDTMLPWRMFVRPKTMADRRAWLEECQFIWPGFAINTIFYAAVLWMVFTMPFVVRRRRRIKRGLCPACAYPVGTSSVCTECGSPVTGVSSIGTRA